MSEEREFMGGSKSKMWTYLIFLGVLVLGALIANFAFSNPTMASNGIHKIFGLPGWALSLVVFLVGALIFWLGLRMETDWPEALGAFLIAGSIAALEFIIGWKHFDIGGMFVLPYLIPIVVFVILLMYGMRRSV